MHPGGEAFDQTTFTNSRDRLRANGLTGAFFDAVVCEAIAAGLCSEHITVDGTLSESFAAAESFQLIEPGDAGPASAHGF